MRVFFPLRWRSGEQLICYIARGKQTARGVKAGNACLTPRAVVCVGTADCPSDANPETGLAGRAELLLALAGLVGNLQVVLDTEDAGDAVGADERDLLVALGIDNAIELDVPFCTEMRMVLAGRWRTC